MGGLQCLAACLVIRRYVVSVCVSGRTDTSDGSVREQSFFSLVVHAHSGCHQRGPISKRQNAFSSNTGCNFGRHAARRRPGPDFHCSTQCSVSVVSDAHWQLRDSAPVGIGGMAETFIGVARGRQLRAPRVHQVRASRVHRRPAFHRTLRDRVESPHRCSMRTS